MDDAIFRQVKQRFDQVLTSGQRAEIGRARRPDDLALLPGYYRALAPGTHPDAGWRRVAFLLPHAKPQNGGWSLGRVLGAAGVSEMRLFQMLRADEPQDILHLRRLCRHVESSRGLSLDWRVFGRMLYYWEFSDKQKIVEDYYLKEPRRSEPAPPPVEDANVR